jgi:hypothetical protein
MEAIGMSEVSPIELEDEADRLRDEIGETADRLRRRLRPSRLLDEWMETSGVKETSAGKILDFAARRHALPTVLLGAGLGFLIHRVLRGKDRRRRTLELDARPARIGRDHWPPSTSDDLVGSVTSTAANELRERARARQQELTAKARAHAASTADELSATLERTLEETLARTWLPAQLRPYAAILLELLVIAALESALAGGSH